MQITTATNAPNQVKTPPLVSTGGRFVVYDADETWNPGRTTVVVSDTCNGAASACTTQTAAVCLNPDGAVANANCSVEGISDDGQYILYFSNATDLVTGVAGASYISRNPLK